MIKTTGMRTPVQMTNRIMDWLFTLFNIIITINAKCPLYLKLRKDEFQRLISKTWKIKEIQKTIVMGEIKITLFNKIKQRKGNK